MRRFQAPENGKSCLFLLFLILLVWLHKLPQISTTMFSKFLSPSRKIIEKSNNNTNTRGRPRQGKLHDDGLACKFGSIIAHIKALVDLLRSERFHIRSWCRSQVLVRNSRQVAIELCFLFNMGWKKCVLAHVMSVAANEHSQSRRQERMFRRERQKEKPTIWLC